MSGRICTAVLAAVFVATTGCGQKVTQTSLSAPASVQAPVAEIASAEAPAPPPAAREQRRRTAAGETQPEPDPEPLPEPQPVPAQTAAEEQRPPEEPQAEDPPPRERKSPEAPPEEPTDDRQTDDDPGRPLEDTGWRSARLTRDGEPWPLIEGTRVDLAFERRSYGEVIRWRSGCNAAGAELVITAARLKLDEIAGTSMYCSDEHSEQDVEVLEFFSRNPYWKLDGDRLRLEAGDTVMEFQRATYW